MNSGSSCLQNIYKLAADTSALPGKRRRGGRQRERGEGTAWQALTAPPGPAGPLSRSGPLSGARCTRVAFARRSQPPRPQRGCAVRRACVPFGTSPPGPGRVGPARLRQGLVDGPGTQESAQLSLSSGGQDRAVTETGCSVRGRDAWSARGQQGCVSVCSPGFLSSLSGSCSQPKGLSQETCRSHPREL